MCFSSFTLSLRIYEARGKITSATEMELYSGIATIALKSVTQELGCGLFAKCELTPEQGASVLPSEM